MLMHRHKLDKVVSTKENSRLGGITYMHRGSENMN